MTSIVVKARHWLSIALLAGLMPAVYAQEDDKPVQMKVSGAFTLGSEAAPVTMVEFSDYECPYCQKYHADAFQQIRKEFIDTGLVRYVVRDFPLSIHKGAIPAARAARCAAEQGHFWEMRDALFKTQLYDVDSMVESVRDLKLDEAKLRQCITGRRMDAAIDRDVTDATQVGVNSTPAFIVGRTVDDSVDGALFAGAQPFDAYAKRIRAAMPAKRPDATAQSR